VLLPVDQLTTIDAQSDQLLPVVGDPLIELTLALLPPRQLGLARLDSPRRKARNLLSKERCPMLPCQPKGGGAAWCPRFIGKQPTDRLALEGELLAVAVHAFDGALIVEVNQAIEDAVEDVGVKHSHGEDVTDKIECVDPDAKAEDADLASLAGLIEGPERLLVGIVDWVAVAVVLGIAEELLAVLTHHVAPQIEVR
jgi:hypothetical protein